MTAVTERMPFALNVSTAKFEQLGAEGGESVRAAVDGGCQQCCGDSRINSKLHRKTVAMSPKQKLDP